MNQIHNKLFYEKKIYDLDEKLRGFLSFCNPQINCIQNAWNNQDFDFFFCVSVLGRLHMNFYAAMCPAGLLGGVRSHQVHQLTQTLAVVCRTPFNVTDITNSRVEPHFKATRRVIGELLKVNTANWLAFPLKYKVFDKYNSSTIKKKFLKRL